MQFALHQYDWRGENGEDCMFTGVGVLEPDCTMRVDGMALRTRLVGPVECPELGAMYRLRVWWTARRREQLRPWWSMPAEVDGHPLQGYYTMKAALHSYHTCGFNPAGVWAKYGDNWLQNSSGMGYIIYGEGQIKDIRHEKSFAVEIKPYHPKEMHIKPGRMIYYDQNGKRRRHDGTVLISDAYGRLHRWEALGTVFNGLFYDFPTDPPKHCKSEFCEFRDNKSRQACKRTMYYKRHDKMYRSKLPSPLHNKYCYRERIQGVYKCPGKCIKLPGGFYMCVDTGVVFSNTVYIDLTNEIRGLVR